MKKLELENYDVSELTKTEQKETNGGLAFTTAAIGFAAGAAIGFYGDSQGWW